jgi:hypothetical protein
VCAKKGAVAQRAFSPSRPLRGPLSEKSEHGWEGKTGRIGSKMTSARLLDGRHLHLSAINSAIDDAHFVAGATGLAEQPLVCILAVDVAGCSRLMRADEGTGHSRSFT